MGEIKTINEQVIEQEIHDVIFEQIIEHFNSDKILESSKCKAGAPLIKWAVRDIVRTMKEFGWGNLKELRARITELEGERDDLEMYIKSCPDMTERLKAERDKYRDALEEIATMRKAMSDYTRIETISDMRGIARTAIKEG
jgi:uncharacterized coiled-coil DUF342 family protein